MRRRAVALAAGVLAAATALAGDDGPASPEGSPLALVHRAADMRASGYSSARSRADAWIRKAESGACGITVKARSSRLREVLASAESLAETASGWRATNAGKAAAAYLKAEKIVQGVSDTAETWICEAAP